MSPAAFIDANIPVHAGGRERLASNISCAKAAIRPDCFNLEIQ